LPSNRVFYLCTNMADLTGMEQIKRLSIIALASDDFLTETLVLKGGNAIDLLQPTGGTKLSRTSYDLDFSIEEDFDSDIEAIKARIENTFINTFSEHGLHVFDYQFANRPKKINDQVKDFWGGYYITFKVISSEDFKRLEGNLEKMQRSAIAVRPNSSSRIEIEISKYEYIGGKIEVEVDGYSIYMYSPQMIVFEKLRAICQQLPQYKDIIPSHSPRPRGRDFYDIALICEQHAIDTSTDQSKQLVRLIFATKKVPLSFIEEIPQHSDIHKNDWQNVKDTLPASEQAKLRPFDYYLDFVMQKFGSIASL
jgi:hypothetical protein